MPSACSRIWSEPARSPFRRLRTYSSPRQVEVLPRARVLREWRGETDSCDAIVRRTLRGVLGSAVEVDRTVVAYFEIVIAVFVCLPQVDAFCFTSPDVEIKFWALTFCCRINADVRLGPPTSGGPPVPGSGYAEPLVLVDVADHCLAAGAIVSGAERVC